ncbi:hypothetical protein KJ765_00490 [Candidatus Micrarchaeota archaeon]|nr:hypothetical protein [Candidatus Micrarchaeota archaeon]
MAFEGLTLESIILILLFLGVTYWLIHLIRQLNRTTKKSFSEITHHMNRLEQQYVKIRPELDEMRAVMDTKVDYDYLERKMHELVKIVMRRKRG